MLELLDCVYHFDTDVPDAYTVYAPLAVASLARLLGDYQFDFEAKVTLTIDYLSGLSYLNDELKVMHRDINPNNLAVTSFDSPKGIILDLDAATTSQSSTDHMKGTIPYLAPEIAELKNLQPGQEPIAYERSVDIWAMGLSTFALFGGQNFQWAHFVPHGGTKSHLVMPELHAEFHRRLDRRQEALQDDAEGSMLLLVKLMTAYTSADRISPTWALVDAKDIKGKKDGRGTIARKTQPKRRLED